MTIAHHDAGSCSAEVLEFQALAADAFKPIFWSVINVSVFQDSVMDITMTDH